MADNRRITLQITGLDKDEGNVRFENFIKQLSAFKHALTETDRVVSDKPSVYFTVVDLRLESPARVVVEAIPITPTDGHAEAVVDKFFSSLNQIESGEAPLGFDYYAFQSFKDMTDLLGKRKVAEVIIAKNGNIISLEHLAHNVEQILGPDEYEVGSVTGMLEQINLHAGQNVFTIYPTNRRPKLRCIFPQHLRSEAIRAVGRHIKVFGRMKYKTRLKWGYPYELLVQKIEIYPPENELPTLNDLKGIAPNATGDLMSEDFVGELRNEW